jgi:hypothetical protein
MTVSPVRWPLATFTTPHKLNSRANLKVSNKASSRVNNPCAHNGHLICMRKQLPLKSRDHPESIQAYTQPINPCRMFSREVCRHPGGRMQSRTPLRKAHRCKCNTAHPLKP